MRPIVQPRRIAAVICAVLGIASLALLWDSVAAAALIDSLALPAAVAGAIACLPYLAAGRGGPRSLIARRLAHVGTLALAASVALGASWAVAATRSETLPWWVAIALIAIAIALVADERWPLRARLSGRAPERSSSS